ncbi:metallophosphatase domain-containing protein [Christiangramia echinicola]|uniref:Calcineurin-like phosphoesterase n=1 Tax=Christiangramia echinicola TaxID=279359 RepID=A0A1H1LTQ3_9FLAO|nr:metallophosphatase domain-containing protein [Christiangramia echinicola]SDR77740.1 Calcineurin-like phosphoesterase [Christiangramia echinicola]
MRLICLADTHNLHHEIPIPDGDVLIHAGDCTDGGTRNETENFLEWFSSQPHKHKVLVPGNHDFYFEKADNLSKIPDGIHLLIDSGLEIENLKIWGSPVTPGIHNWAFNRERGNQIRKHWEQIPVDTDILITHTPPFEILDEIGSGIKLGCEELKRILPIVQPKYHLFGHIHNASGSIIRSGISYFNLSMLDERMRIMYSPRSIEL